MHAQFERLYDAAALRVDALAERVVALGGLPLATMGAALQAASLEEDPTQPAARDMVARVVADFDALNGDLRRVAALADDAADVTTVNLLEDAADEQAQTAWMFKAFLD